MSKTWLEIAQNLQSVDVEQQLAALDYCIKHNMDWTEPDNDPDSEIFNTVYTLSGSDNPALAQKALGLVLSLALVERWSCEMYCDQLLPEINMLEVQQIKITEMFITSFGRHSAVPQPLLNAINKKYSEILTEDDRQLLEEVQAAKDEQKAIQDAAEAALLLKKAQDKDAQANRLKQSLIKEHKEKMSNPFKID